MSGLNAADWQETWTFQGLEETHGIVSNTNSVIQQDENQLPQNQVDHNGDSIMNTDDPTPTVLEEHDTEQAGEPNLQQGPEYQPTADQIEAARYFEQFNDENALFRDLTEQEMADAELAMALQAQEEARYNSDNDVDQPPESYECACGDAFTWEQAAEMVYLNCGHIRCNDCLNQNVAVGLESKRNYPPRCCGAAIELDATQDHLTDDNILKWVEVKDEYEDQAPVYCAFKVCSAYLPKEALDPEHKWAWCSECKVRTCSGCLCLESDHVEVDKCPERIEKLDRELMTKKRWKPCPGCKHMIERIEGCDHMTCDCGMEFCYECGRQYVGGMPCNCHGQREWVDEEAGANDPAMQQRILDNLAEREAEEGDGDDEGEGDN